MNGQATRPGKSEGDTFDSRVQQLSDRDRDLFEELCRQVERALERQPNDLDAALRSLPTEGPLRDLLLVHAGRCWLERDANSGAQAAELVRDVPALSQSDWVVGEITAWLASIKAASTTKTAESTTSNNGVPKPPYRPFSGVDPEGPANFRVPAHYLLIRECRRSGMGQALVVQNMRIKRLEVLKTANALVRSDPAALNRFKEEPLMASRFNHPGIVTVYNVDESDGIPYFTMEYMNAGSLSERLQAGPIAARPAAQLIAQASRVMQMIHEKGHFTHGDIKPENLLFTRTDDGTECMKVADFGLTRPIPGDWRATLTGRNLDPSHLPKTRDLTGTPGYLPPEAFDADFRSQHETGVLGRSADIFAMGVTLYRCLTGHMPYQNVDGQIDLLGPVLNELRPPAELNPTIDPVLNAICRRSLAKSADERFGDFREFADALEGWLRDPVPNRVPPAPPLPITVVVPSKLKTIADYWRSPGPLAATLVAAALLAVLIGQWVNAHSSPGKVIHIHGLTIEPDSSRVKIDDLAWQDDAKTVFETRYGNWFLQVTEKSPATAREVLKRLNVLGKDRESSAISLVLAKNPELAFALADAQKPDAIAQELSKLDGQEEIVFRNLLALYPGNRASDQMFLAWQKHRVAICELWRRGLVGSEAIFMWDGQEAGSDVYDRWLSSLFSGSNLSARELADRVFLVQAQGYYLRERLAKDERFRQTFEQLWEKLRRVTADERRPLSLFMGYPLTWDYLSLPDGEELAQNFGFLPAKLFVGRNPLPADIWRPVKNILKERRIDALDALLDDRMRDSIIALIQGKDLDGLHYSIALSKLLRATDAADRKQKLDAFLAMSVEELQKEFKYETHPESWDDNLRGYLKVAKHLAIGQELERGEVPIAVSNAIRDVVDASSQAISNLTSGTVPAWVVKVPVDIGDELFTKWRQEEAKQHRAENKKAAEKMSDDVFAQREREIAEFCASQPTAALQLILSLPEAERLADSAAICRYFWATKPECAAQLKMLRERIGRLSLLPSGRLICDSKTKIASAKPAGVVADAPIQDEETTWHAGLADWWQETFLASVASN